MTKTEAYIRDAIKTWVWSGFHDEAAVNDMLEDILEDGVDVEAMRRAISAEFEMKAEAEKSWPVETDCDRLDRAFMVLDADGVCAVQNAGYTMSDGYTDVTEAVHDRGLEKYRGYCFYHGQDLERAVRGEGLMIAFGDLDDDPAKGVVIGGAVCAALKQAGFTTEWDGTIDQRINVPKLDWKRRYT